MPYLSKTGGNMMYYLGGLHKRGETDKSSWARFGHFFEKS